MTTIHYGLTRRHLSPPGEPHADIEAALAVATREVLAVATVEAFRAVDRDHLRPGVRYRVLAPVEARIIPKVAKRLEAFASQGAEIRTVATVPMAALVVDGTLALLPGDQRELTVFRLPSVVRTVAELFERLWPAGTPYTSGTVRTAGPARSGSEPTGRELDLLALLVDGYTDESAAARLGVSVRTVRRMVSDLMNRLSARSRFQAGAKAADRGWLMELAG
ncbi:helix-turn-helix transcriptional regulator [Amycolatopsis sp. lyj-108]|uniref:helix-turn-helix transcriptional regulator n=1 Tax=Amycolatopsis sp. lyj-108 TaxID=2789286 RepID=UPI003977E474